MLLHPLYRDLQSALCLSLLIATGLPIAPKNAWAEGANEPERVSFSRQVLPILSDKCFACHGPDTADEGLVRLDSFAAATADLGGYKAIDPEDSDSSVLLQRILSADDPMPPADAEKQLTDQQRQILQRWVEQGGEYEQHWAFVSPTKVSPDGTELNSADAIDYFVQEKLQKVNVLPASQAEPETLARRAALVLTGLPPDPQQLDKFLADKSENAYERLVEELLASPNFGEHQARYWLDAVRYGDTHGLHLDNRRGIYPYRDWVVRAFNQNLPLDDFVIWQLAGDLLPNPTLEQLTATGFVRLNPSTGEGGAIAEEFQAKNNFDRTETLGTVMLGMSLVCARCHTHKYDPIPHQEYYQLMAYFNSTAEPPLDGNSYTYGDTAKVPRDQNQWDRWQESMREKRQLLNQTDQQMTDPERFQNLLSVAHRHLESATASETESSPAVPWADLIKSKNWDALPHASKLQIIAAAESIFGTEYSQTANRTLAFENEAKQTFTTTLVARDLPQPRTTRVLKRGEYDMPIGEPVQPGVISVLGPLADDAPPSRLGLARWLTAPQHPLVARVLVNRMWQHIFGFGLVRTPEDFGLQGEQPTHPELLDWLAVELHDSDWNLKQILKLMVTSETFKQQSTWRSDVSDPDNRLWTRGPSFRLDAEVIRDMGLWSSGLLDPHLGGEGVKPYQPEGMWKALAHPASNTKQYEKDSGPLLYRRSLYVYWKRTSPHPMMTLFDAPDRESSCVRRSRTNTSLQSLGMFNETQRIEMGRKLAERLLLDADDDDDDQRLRNLFRLIASRKPTAAESTACLTLLQQMQDRYRDNASDAMALLATGDAPCDNNLPAADLAAWTQVCVTVLASDLAILLY